MSKSGLLWITGLGVMTLMITLAWSKRQHPARTRRHDPGVKSTQTQVEDPPDGGTFDGDPVDPSNPFPRRRD